MTLQAREHRFVEEIALFFEAAGMPRMAGRIVGHLLVCDPPVQSLGQITDALEASKASVSTNTRLLVQMGLIERVPTRGERGVSYQIAPGAWEKALQQKLRGLSVMRALLERGLDVLADAPPERRARLEDIHGIYAFFEREFPAMLDRLHQERRKTP